MLESIAEKYREGLRGSDGMQIEDERAAVDELMTCGWLSVFTGLVGLAVGRGGARLAAAKPETNLRRIIGGLSKGVAAGGGIALIVGAGLIGVGNKAQNIIREVSSERGYLV